MCPALTWHCVFYHVPASEQWHAPMYSRAQAPSTAPCDIPEAQAWDDPVMQRCCANGYPLCRPGPGLGGLSVSVSTSDQQLWVWLWLIPGAQQTTPGCRFQCSLPTPQGQSTATDMVLQNQDAWGH